jgi:hypothetical protein
MKATDFHISEENKPQTIDSLGNAENVPLEIAILFDVSASTDSMFKFQQETAAKFLQEVLRSEDRATIFTIGIKPVLVQERDTAERSQSRDPVDQRRPKSRLHFMILSASRQSIDRRTPRKDDARLSS